MEPAFLIMSYTENNLNKYLNTCVNSIRKFYPDTKIVIVDNFVSGNPTTKWDSNVYYYKNDTNSRELGAIWYGFKRHPEVDRWIVMQDSTKLNKEIPIDISQPSDGDLFRPFWCELPEHYSPSMPSLIRLLDNTDVTYEQIKNKHWKSTCGVMFISDSSILQRLVDLKFDKILPSTKIEAVSTEIMVGLAASYLLNTELQPLNEKPLSFYMKPENPWTFVEKIGGGAGPDTTGRKTISKNSKLHPSNLISGQRFATHEEAVKFVTDSVIKDEELINEMVSLGNSYLSFSPHYNGVRNVSMVYGHARHKVFTFKYFPSEYNR